MNHRLVSLSLCLLTILLLTACQPKEQPLIPVTGAEDASTISDQTKLARENVLEYVISSSRIPTAPPSTDWQLDDGKQANGEYRFCDGDWVMLVWLADAEEEYQRVIIINKVENVAWRGYVASDGHVVGHCRLPLRQIRKDYLLFGFQKLFTGKLSGLRRSEVRA
jgi:hypothetical protein